MRVVAAAALVAEILIAGAGALAWLALVAFAMGAASPDELAVAVSTPVAAAGLLLFTYALGVLADRVADSVLTRLDHRLRPGRRGSGPSLALMRLRILHESEGMSQFAEYIRSRLRIARATGFNGAAVLVAGALVLARDAARQDVPANAVRLATAALAVAAFVTPAALYAAARIRRTYEKRTRQMYEILLAREDREGVVRLAAREHP